MRRSFLLYVSLAAGLSALACTAGDKTDQAFTAPVEGTADSFVVATITPGQPIPGLTARQLQLFNRGIQVFAAEFTPATGLGPLFNSTSCAACHNDPALGGYGDSVEVHVTAHHPGMACNTLGPAGGPVVQQHATPALEALGIFTEPTPAGATGTGVRTTPLIFGLGLLEAVGDRTIKVLARIPYPDGVRGRPAILPNGRVGRFGRKAATASLDEFNAGAFFNEMGVTNALNPVEGTIAGTAFPAGTDPAPEPELDAASLAAADAFVRFLAPPAPVPFTGEAILGRQLFAQVRCTNCHLPVLITDYNPVRALSFRRIKFYTDLLLHDLGPEDADICNGVAKPGEFRTQPLIGMQFLDMFMHDGASETVDEAIQRHGGEASAARARFLQLAPSDRAALVAFVKSL
jgi:CxxC motif-containing protein (DUF1111 family)